MSKGKKDKPVKDQVFDMLYAGAKVDEIEKQLNIPRDKIGRIKSDWLVIARKDIADRKKSYLLSNHEAFKTAKRNARKASAEEEEKK